MDMHAPVTKPLFHIDIGDARSVLRTWPDAFAHCCVTSPPYFGLRDYGVADQIGLEATPDAFVRQLVEVFREVRRVLRDDGTLWLNLGDSYAGSWGAQSRGATTSEAKSRLQGASMLEARTIEAFLLGKTQTGSLKNTPGLKNKDLIGIPWRVAFALQSDGWYLRQDIIWHKPNPMPESVRDRCTKAHEYMFLLSKSEKYYFNADAMQEPAKKGAAGSEFHTGKTGDHQLGRASRKPRKQNSTNESFVPGATEHGGLHREGSEREPETRNKRSVWTIATKPFKEAHFATFPPALVEPCILAGCPSQGIVIDPFGGAGTTGLVANRHGRHACLIELNPAYAAMARTRIETDLDPS